MLCVIRYKRKTFLYTVRADKQISIRNWLSHITETRVFGGGNVKSGHIYTVYIKVFQQFVE